jgi:hypothetical protein
MWSELKKNNEKRWEEENSAPDIVKFLVRKVFAVSKCYKPRGTEDTQNQTQLHTTGKPQRTQFVIGKKPTLGSTTLPQNHEQSK